MKTTFASFLIIVLFIPAFVFGQARQFPDSVRVELPQQGAIAIFELRVYAKDKDIISAFPSRLAEITEHIRKSIVESEWPRAHTVTVTPDKADKTEKASQIIITQKDEAVTRLRVKESTVLELLPPGWELTLRLERGVVHLYAPDLAALEAISRLNFEPLTAYLATQNEFVKTPRMGVYTRVIMRDDKITPAGTTDRRVPEDMLGLHAGAAVGLIGDRLYPEFNFLTAIYLANRFQANRQRMGVGYELKLFSGRTAENSFRSMPASFITASYGINFSDKRSRWTALGVGYMVHNRSDMFTGKTLKVFIESDIGSDKLNLVPELYLTDDFRKSIFGIKLNYKF